MVNNTTIFSFCRIPPEGIPFRGLVLYRSIASYDRLVKAITLSIWILIISIDVWIAYLLKTSEISIPPSSLALLYFVYAITLLPPLVTFLFSPREFSLTTDGLQVKRPIRSFVIPYREIVEVKRVEWTHWGIRLFGSGGLYGFFGLFKLKGLGRVWVYVTNRDSVLLIKTRKNQYLISPKNAEEFLERLEKTLEMFGH